MGMHKFLLPDIGNYENIPVIELLVSEGDTVEKDQSVLTLESDKATMEIPAPVSGVIRNLQIKLEDKVSKGSYICDIETSMDAPAPAPSTSSPLSLEGRGAGGEGGKPSSEASTPTAASPSPQPSPVKGEGAGLTQAAEKPINAQPSGAKFHASPSVRAYARHLGVELAHVTGTGPKGRIQKQDVEAYIKAVMQGEKPAPKAPVTAGAGIPQVPAIDFSQFGPTEEKELSRIKKLSGKHLTACWLNIPHVTQFDEADITELEAFRTSLKARADKAGVKLTPLPFVMMAVVQALKEFPQFNASLNPGGEKLILKRYYNIGVAVDTPNGLVVPVVKDVDKKGLFELARELAELGQKARDGKLAPSDMQGGTFSISSLGGIGGTQFTPIVNAPEVAILGLSKAKMAPVWNGASFEPRLMMPFSVSYDHRVIDGAEGVRFTTRLAALLRDLREMLI
ncbi:dihydrolipoyllysine-residue acetyltransferase [Thiofaba sp. EF100]|uniref:dihydrolipoyllysine-residue acetyltransferase n=1 Tax=Thiofaba sp. EF100 TaxID=3121274 RepID=UPI00322149AA